MDKGLGPPPPTLHDLQMDKGCGPPDPSCFGETASDCKCQACDTTAKTGKLRKMAQASCTCRHKPRLQAFMNLMQSWSAAKFFQRQKCVLFPRGRLALALCPARSPTKTAEIVCRDLHGRDKVIRGYTARQEVVAVLADARERYIPGGRATGAVRPESYMRQLRALKFVDRVCIAQTHWIISYTADGDPVIRDRIDAEPLRRLCLDHNGARAGVEVLDDGRHPVHKVVGLVQVASQTHTEPLVDGEVQGLGLLLLQCACGLFEVVRVTLVVGGDPSECRLACLHEEDFLGQGIDESRPPSRAGDDSRPLRGRKHQVADVFMIGHVVPRPGFVAPAEISHEASALRPAGLILAEEGELVQKRISVRLPPDVVKLDAMHASPLGMFDQASARVIRGWQLPLIASKHEAGNPASSLPHLVQPVKMLLKELRGFINDDQVVAQHDTHGFRQRTMKQEGAGGRYPGLPLGVAAASWRAGLQWVNQ